MRFNQEKQPLPSITTQIKKEIPIATPTDPAITLLFGAFSSAVINGDGFP